MNHLWPCHQQEWVRGTLQLRPSGWFSASMSHEELQATGGSTRCRPDSTAACDEPVDEARARAVNITPSYHMCLFCTLYGSDGAAGTLDPGEHAACSAAAKWVGLRPEQGLEATREAV